MFMASKRSYMWKKFRIGTSVSVSGNVARRLRSANEGRPTRFLRYFPVTGKVIYAFLYYYVTDNRRCG